MLECNEETYPSIVFSCTLQYQWHFYSNQFILAKASSFLVIPLYWGGAKSSQITSLGSIQVCHLMWSSAFLYLSSEPHIYSFHSPINLYLVGQSMVVGHTPMVHTCSSNVHQSHRHDSTHPGLFLPSQVTSHLYVECNTARHSNISHLWSNASRMVTHPCINKAYDCITSVIKHKTLTSCYVSPS